MNAPQHEPPVKECLEIADCQKGDASAAYLTYRLFLHKFSAMTAIEQRRLKGLLKTAVTEVLEERQDLLRDAFRETFEDMAMLRAIQAGQKTPIVSRKKIFQRLDRGA